VRRTPLRLGPIELAPPGVHVVLVQLGLAAVDILAVATALWILLPAAGISFIAFAAVYAAALTLGVLSHVPGGLGVFEVAILYAIGNKAPPSAVAAALVIYRAIYFLLPDAAAGRLRGATRGASSRLSSASSGLPPVLAVNSLQERVLGCSYATLRASCWMFRLSAI
jgi:phosphatidylglycerol lysyltransferase